MTAHDVRSFEAQLSPFECSTRDEPLPHTRLCSADWSSHAGTRRLVAVAVRRLNRTTTARYAEEGGADSG